MRANHGARLELLLPGKLDHGPFSLVFNVSQIRCCLNKLLALIGFTTLSVAGVLRADSAAPPSKEDPRLVSVVEASMPMNAVTTTRDGRIFVGFPHMEGGPGMQVGEVRKDGTIRPYPDAAWNAWTPDNGDPITAFVRFNALRIGPDGKLWIVDTGTPGFHGTVVKGGAKLVVIDLQTDKVERTIPLQNVAKEKSYIDDIRFNGKHAYISDAGEPALIVLDLASGNARRVLENEHSTTAERPIRAEGQVLMAKGEQVKFHADQLEVSPDGKLLYFQPGSGPTYQIQTRWLDDESVKSAELKKHVSMFADTPSTGGTAIDRDGNIYYSDPDNDRILKITPDARISTLIADPRLIWPDAMWIDDDGYLWIPCTQVNRTEPFNGGLSRVALPVHVFKMKIGAKPSPIDHP